MEESYFYEAIISSKRLKADKSDFTLKSHAGKVPWNDMYRRPATINSTILL